MKKRTCALLTAFILIVVLTAAVIGIIELNNMREEIPDRYYYYKLTGGVAGAVLLISWFTICLCCSTPSKGDRNVEAARTRTELTTVHVPTQPRVPSQPQLPPIQIQHARPIQREMRLYPDLPPQPYVPTQPIRLYPDLPIQPPSPPQQPSRPRTVIDIETDASQHGAGAYCTPPKGNDDWLYVHWECDDPSLEYETVDVWEFAAMQHAIKRWAPRFKGCHFEVHSDRRDSVQHLNDDERLNKDVLQNIKEEIEEILFDNNVTAEAKWIPREENTTADVISRLSTEGMMDRLNAILGSDRCDKKGLTKHMSEQTATYVPMFGNYYV